MTKAAPRGGFLVWNQAGLVDPRQNAMPAPKVKPVYFTPLLL